MVVNLIRLIPNRTTEQGTKRHNINDNSSIRQKRGGFKVTQIAVTVQFKRKDPILYDT